MASPHGTHKGCRYMLECPTFPPPPECGSYGSRVRGYGVGQGKAKCSDTPCGCRGGGGVASPKTCQGEATLPGDR